MQDGLTPEQKWKYENGLRILTRWIARAYIKDQQELVRKSKSNIKREERVMPIKGVSEVVRLPRRGKIRLGIKKEIDGRLCPEPTDYFVCPDEVKAVFGEKPRELRIMFPNDDEKQWASQFLRCYSDKGELMCRGDGETAVAKVETVNKETGKVSSKLLEMPCIPARCPIYKDGLCRQIMNLQFLLPECPGFGVYQLDTSSFHSIVNINSSLELIRAICGRLAMIPLTLKLVEQEVLADGERKRVQVLKLEPSYSLVDMQKYAQTPIGQALLLPVPDSEAPEDCFSIAPAAVEEKALEAGKLGDLWTRVKSKIYHLEVLDYQVRDWFKRNYSIDIRLSDFDLVTPPSLFTAKSLEHFLCSIEYHADHS